MYTQQISGLVIRASVFGQFLIRKLEIRFWFLPEIRGTLKDCSFGIWIIRNHWEFDLLWIFKNWSSWKSVLRQICKSTVFIHCPIFIVRIWSRLLQNFWAISFCKSSTPESLEKVKSSIYCDFSKSSCPESFLLKKQSVVRLLAINLNLLRVLLSNYFLEILLWVIYHWALVSPFLDSSELIMICALRCVESCSTISTTNWTIHCHFMVCSIHILSILRVAKCSMVKKLSLEALLLITLTCKWLVGLVWIIRPYLELSS